MHSGKYTPLFLLIFLFTIWFSARFLLPLTSPFLAGTLLALAAEPMVRLLHRRARVPRGAGGILGVLMVFCLLSCLFFSLCAVLIRQIRMLSGVLPNLEQTALGGIQLLEGWMLDLSGKAPESIQPLLRENVRTLFSSGSSLLGKFSGWLLGLAGSLLGHLPDSALGLGTAVISGCMISAKLPGIQAWLLSRIPRKRLQYLADLWKGIKQTLLGYLNAQFRLMGVTFCLLALGFSILRIPYSLLWAAGVCLVDAFPVLGTGTVLLPWALVCILQHDLPRAFGLAGIYVTISVIRSVLEPRLLGKQLGLDPLVTLMAMYAGYKLWGIAGMIFAPLLTVVLVQAMPKQA